MHAATLPARSPLDHHDSGDLTPSGATGPIMTDDHEHEHDTPLDAWMKAAAGSEVPTERLVQAFAEAFAAIWRRAHVTLGDVTLTAITDRVLYTAAERFPFLASLAVQPSGLECQELRERGHEQPREQLAEGIRFVLLELLTVLENLTAGVLSPALHAELSRVTPGANGAAPNESQGEPRTADRADGEGAKS